MNPLLSVSDVAKLLNVSESLIYRLKDEGKLRHCRIGRGAVRFRTEDIEEYLQNSIVEVKLEPRRAPMPRLKHLRL